MNKYADFIGRSIAWIIRAFLLVFCFIKIYYADYAAAILFLFVFGLALLPTILNQVYNVKLHWLLDITVAYIIFSHMAGFLGIYDIWPIWDDIGHIIGAMTISFIGFFFIFAFNYHNKIRVTMPFIAVFTVFWMMGWGAIWEIIEFLWDTIVTMSGVITATGQYSFSQNGLFDTMVDLTWDLIGALVTMVACIFFVRRAKKSTLDEVTTPIIKIFEGRPKRITS